MRCHPLEGRTVGGRMHSADGADAPCHCWLQGRVRRKVTTKFGEVTVAGLYGNYGT